MSAQKKKNRSSPVASCNDSANVILDVMSALGIVPGTSASLYSAKKNETRIRVMDSRVEASTLQARTLRRKLRHGMSDHSYQAGAY